MAREGFWTPGKIILTTAVVILGIGSLICVGFGIFVKDRMGQIFGFMQASPELATTLSNDFPSGGRVIFKRMQDGTFTLVVGIRDGGPEEPLDARLDKIWRAYTSAYAEGGLPVDHVAVGHDSGSGLNSGVSGWEDHQVHVDELVARTGLPAPESSSLFEEEDESKGFGFPFGPTGPR